MRYLWPLVHLLQGAYLLVWSALCILLALLVRLATRSPALPLAMARRLWSPPLFWTAGIHLEVRGLEHLGIGPPLLIAANHQSFLDVPALFRVLPFPLRFVAKTGLRGVPLLGWYMRAMGMVFVERSGESKTGEARRQAVEVLAAGGCLVTFPEGTRSWSGEVGPFKPGALAPAIEAGVPVVPVAIEGAHRLLPRGGFRLRPGTLRIWVGAPIETEGRRPGGRRALAEEVRGEIVASLEAGAASAGAGRDR